MRISEFNGILIKSKENPCLYPLWETKQFPAVGKKYDPIGFIMPDIRFLNISQMYCKQKIRAI